MASAPELMTIFQRISSRVEEGTESYNSLSKIIVRRAEVEDKIAELLKSLIPEKTDPNDPLLSAVVEEIKQEISIHTAFAGEIRNKLIVHNTRYMATLKENQKKIENSLKHHQSNIGKYITDLDKMKKDIDSNMAKLQSLPPNKKPSQEQYIQKIVGQMKLKQDELNKEVMKLHQGAIPMLHKDFSEFDSGRLLKMQAGITQMYTLLNYALEAKSVHSKSLLTKMNNFDGTDKSQRFVTRAFDPTVKSLNDETDLYVFAIEDYKSEDPGDLSFVRGDKILVLAQHQSGWWDGKIGDKKGLFPNSFVKLPTQEVTKNEPIGAVFLCVKDYEAAGGGEISLLSGDLVYVDYVIKERCSGRNIRTGKRGYFPLSVLEKRL